MKKVLKLVIFTLALSAFSFANAQEEKRERPSPEKMFEKLDTDKNGEISLAEFKDREAIKKEKEKKRDDMMEKRFSKMDANSNQTISKEEFMKALEIMKERRMKKQAKK
tara:strand:- start:1285 stop:1611 length:327 start_codon:yes stop_codon:yes gene_type:complete